VVEGATRAVVSVRVRIGCPGEVTKVGSVDILARFYELLKRVLHLVVFFPTEL
jgi:hypothetical protein